MNDKYLTLKIDKKTGKTIGFCWQGDRPKYTREQMLEFIEKNNSISIHDSGFLWELCEDETFMELLEEVDRQRDLQDICNQLSEIEERINEAVDNLYYLRSTLKDFLEKEVDHDK